MNQSLFQSIALIYGKKELIHDFLEQFKIDRQHDGAELRAILLKGEMKEEIYLER